MVNSDLLARAAAWAADDPDPTTRAEIEALIAAKNTSELEDRFLGFLEFGTAGLRGLIGGGPNRMNRLVVGRATAGLCAYVLEHTPNAAERGIAIGFDGRTMSREFARDVAEIALGFGLRVHLFDDVCPTPLLAFAVRDTNAAAGVMVTASHNPPAYNGYKVYWGNGAQIVPPHDVGIAKAIDGVGAYASIPRRSLDAAGALRSALGRAIEERYLARVHALIDGRSKPRALRIAYTALHGVGDRLANEALRRAGFAHVSSVPEQAAPDAAFPTVAFPNPEEKGAMDLVLALAKRENAELAIANDPDADRLAVAVRDAGGGYVMLSGNEVGVLMGDALLARPARTRSRVVICTIVSSPMLGAIAAAHGAQWETTLTGFKWIANRALELEAAPDTEFVFGYEEALGYSVGDVVRDKDGIGAAVVMADIAATAAEAGQSLLDVLEAAYRRYGLYLSRQVAVTMPGLDGAARIGRIMDAVRKAPPRELAGRAILAVHDRDQGTTLRADGTKSRIDGPMSNVLLFDVDGGHRVTLRPSGTEPKIKYYFDVRETLAPGESLEEGRRRGEATIDTFVKALAVITDAIA